VVQCVPPSPRKFCSVLRFPTQKSY